MLTASGAKLLDFGLAKRPSLTASSVTTQTLSFEQRQLTAEGTILGTFQYMAPEQLEGHTADARTDVFSFGTLLYEMATGRKAFDGQSQASLIASILTGQPEPISSTQTTIDVAGPVFALDHVVDRCLAKSARTVVLQVSTRELLAPERKNHSWWNPGPRPRCRPRTGRATGDGSHTSEDHARQARTSG